MSHALGMSGSTILSDPRQFDKLFKKGLPHIEIGEFPDRDSFFQFYEKAKERKVSFGVHSPLIRGNSKYDLIDEVVMSPVEARSNFEREVKELAELGAEYVLIHFPYFKSPPVSSIESTIEEGFQFLSDLQNRYGIPIVCEPKLGPERSPHNIQALHDHGLDLIVKYGLYICIDLGDYHMATKEKWEEYIRPLRPHTKVVHLHHVAYVGEKYYWVPIHPDFENDPGSFTMEPCLSLLKNGADKYFIFEHTPHTSPSELMVDQGVEWIRQQLG
ncbi:TIM barrel protein [Halobacillus mangrovi]|uniref:TIM barrel protein n=1 Tax=Halobacillus mangrovi TaxID=402384 RepID=UPI003D998318